MLKRHIISLEMARTVLVLVCIGFVLSLFTRVKARHLCGMSAVTIQENL